MTHNKLSNNDTEDCRFLTNNFLHLMMATLVNTCSVQRSSVARETVELFLHRCQTVKGNLNTQYCTQITEVWGGRVCLVQNYLANRILVWLLKQTGIYWTTYINYYYYNVLLIISSIYIFSKDTFVGSLQNGFWPHGWNVQCIARCAKSDLCHVCQYSYW
jgi:hypothetical protein